MKTTTAVLAGCLAAGCATTDVDPPRGGDARLPDGVRQLVVRADDPGWRPCPENLPAGCEIAVLEGDPRAEGLFTVRFRVSDDFVMPPHTHPREERVTVLDGRMAVAFGAGAARADAARFGPGDYYVNARDEIHTVWVDEAAVIQITGDGPWEAHFVD